MAGVIYGFHAIEEALKRGRGEGTVKYLKASASSSKRITGILSLAGEKGYVLKAVSREELDQDASGGEHRGIVLLRETRSGERRQKERSFEEWLELFASGRQDYLLLLLDGITDPQNLGAILRSADQFGVDLVLIPQRRSAKESPLVHTISAGASAWVNTVSVVNLVRAMEQLKEYGFWIYGADMEGDPLWGARLGGKSALVLGSEGKGISALVKKKCDALLKIPTTGHIDSLNVSVATGIMLYEYRRQGMS